MTFVNDTIKVTPGSGATVATFSPGSGSTEFQAVMLADASGHIYETKPTYNLCTPPLSCSVANLYHWELFNGSGSTVTVSVYDIRVRVHTDVAVTGTLGVRYDFFRTTAISSGGTAGNYESSSTTAANFCRFDTSDSAISSGVSFKTVLTSITTGAWIFTTFAFPEETNTAANLHQGYNILSDKALMKPLMLHPGEGIAVRQGPVTTVGNIGWNLRLTTDP